MEIDMSALGAIKPKSCTTIMDRAHLWTKAFTFQILTDLCGYKQNRTMISMLKGHRIGRTLVKRKSGLLKQGLSFYF
jgi:hypothetical protein